MTVTTLKEVLKAAVEAVAQLDASFQSRKLKYVDGLTFDSPPIERIECFDAQAGDVRFTSSFGREGQREVSCVLEVRLAMPAQPLHVHNAKRKHAHSSDIEKVADRLEAQDWQPAGVMACIYDGADTDRTSAPEWWVTTLRFLLTFWGTINAPPPEEEVTP